MKYIVTGGMGYVGSVLVDLLKSEGKEVIILDRLCEPRCDLTNRDEVFETVSRLKDEYRVVHLAGLFEKDIKKRSSIKDEDYFLINQKATENLVDALLEHKTKLESFTISSASLVNYIGEKKDPYAESKKKAEEASERLKHVCPVNVLRITRVIGVSKGKIPVDIVSELLEDMLNGKEMDFKIANLVRDYVHVNDVAKVLANVKGSGFSVRNLCSNMPMRMGRIAELVKEDLQKLGKEPVLRMPPADGEKRERFTSDFGDILSLKTSEDAVKKAISEYIPVMKQNAL